MIEKNLSISLKKLAAITNGSWINLKPESQNLLISLVSTDSRFSCEGGLFLALSGDIFDGHKFINDAIKQNVLAVCINRNKQNSINIPDTIPLLLVDDTYCAYQNIATYHRLNLKNITVIGLTGSNGKTSTKDILYSILSSEFGKDKVYATKANTNNHVGVPQNLLNLNNDHRYAIIEMGTNHPGEMPVLVNTTIPDIALLTSIGPSHLEHFKDLKGVAIEKRTLFSNYKKNKLNCAIIPNECPEKETVIAEIPKSIPIKTFGYTDNSDLKIIYSSSNLCSSDFSLIWKDNQEKKYKVHSTLTGKHQALNAAGASFIADIIGIKRENIVKSLSNPAITGMRMRISTHKSVTWINDAYNANPASANAGIEYIDEVVKSNNKINKVYLLLGNMLELGKDSLNEHIKILKKACSLENRIVVCAVGSIILEASNTLNNDRIIKFNNKEEAINYLKVQLKTDDIVYLKSSRDAGLRKIEAVFEGK
jgi:UDP-N-acetylmuramoyl-tripeptide--D-alanyl-D-alanine ligase